jgi:hypothetical protein
LIEPAKDLSSSKLFSRCKEPPDRVFRKSGAFDCKRSKIRCFLNLRDVHAQWMFSYKKKCALKLKKHVLHVLDTLFQKKYSFHMMWKGFFLRKNRFHMMQGIFSGFFFAFTRCERGLKKFLLSSRDAKRFFKNFCSPRAMRRGSLKFFALFAWCEKGFEDFCSFHTMRNELFQEELVLSDVVFVRTAIFVILRLKGCVRNNLQRMQFGFLAHRCDRGRRFTRIWIRVNLRHPRHLCANLYGYCNSEIYQQLLIQPIIFNGIILAIYYCFAIWCVQKIGNGNEGNDGGWFVFDYFI